MNQCSANSGSAAKLAARSCARWCASSCASARSRAARSGDAMKPGGSATTLSNTPNASGAAVAGDFDQPHRARLAHRARACQQRRCAAGHRRQGGSRRGPAPRRARSRFRAPSSRLQARRRGRGRGNHDFGRQVLAAIGQRHRDIARRAGLRSQPCRAARSAAGPAAAAAAPTARKRRGHRTAALRGGGRRATSAISAPVQTKVSTSQRHLPQLLEQCFDLGEVGIGERFGFRQVRDQRRCAAAEQAVDQPARFAADIIRRARSAANRGTAVHRARWPPRPLRPAG